MAKTSFRQICRRIKFYSIIILLRISSITCYPNKWNFDPTKWMYLTENSDIIYCKDIYTFSREIGHNRAQLFNRFRETRELPPNSQLPSKWIQKDKNECTQVLRDYVTAQMISKNWVIYDVLSIHNEGTCGENNIRLRFRVWLDYVAYGCPCLNKQELHRTFEKCLKK